MSPVRLSVRPGRGLGGSFRPPGDKSITHRAYLLGSLARGETLVENPNPGLDCASTLACLEALGVALERSAGRVALQGRDMVWTEPHDVLDCGNSGTTLRLLAGPLAAQPFLSVATGDASLRARPVDRIIEPLRRMGAQLWARDGDRLPPLVLRGGPLRAVAYRAPVASAQVASAVLLAGLFARGETVVEIPGPARDHTERMLPALGVPCDRSTAGRVAVRGPARLAGTRIAVPGDFSAAAFLLAAAAATPGASVTARDVNLNPTRTGLLEVLAAMGADVRPGEVREEGGEPVGDVTVLGPERLMAADVPLERLPTLLDEIPVWAVLAATARGVSSLGGAGELRVKESDRLSSIASNLRRLGGRVEETHGGLAIEGGALRGGVVPSFQDHRIAMAFAALGAAVPGGVTVEDAGSIATSYPGFAATLADLGAEVGDWRASAVAE